MKSELAKARDKWLNGEEGKRCCEGTPTGQYLQNRLELAFLAGAKFTEERIENENKLLKKEVAEWKQTVESQHWEKEEYKNALKNANIWLGGKMEEPKMPTIWLKKYTQRHNECVDIIEQALKGD